MTVDERTILDATLAGSFDLWPPVSPTVLVTTSCGATGGGAIDVRNGGWWVRLTADCWPREAPSLSHPLVQQLSEVFPAVELPTDDDGTCDGSRSEEHVALQAKLRGCAGAVPDRPGKSRRRTLPRWPQG